MKKMLMVGVTLLALVSAVGAQSAREIRFGTEPGYKPFEYKNTAGQMEGFDIEDVYKRQLYDRSSIKSTLLPTRRISRL